MKFLSTLLLAFLLLGSPAFAGSYLEYKMTLGKQKSGVVKTWYQAGNSRSEVEIPGVPVGLGSMVALTLKDKPNKIFVLNQTNATYMEMADSDPQKEKKNLSDIEVTVIGQEKVNGFNSTHITLKHKDKKELEHFWLSKEIKGYKELQQIKGKYMAEDEVIRAYEAKGIQGFPVKMRMQTEEGEMTMDLVKSEELDIPGSKFSLDGYTKAPDLPIGPGGMDMEKLKNMTPEERQKMVEEMMKMYGK